MRNSRAKVILPVLAVPLSQCAGEGPPPSPTDPSSPSPPLDGRFVAERVVSLPNFPVSMVFTSPTRILVTEKGGFAGIQNASVRVVEDDRLLDRRLITFRNVQTGGERGLLGVTLDPNYQDNRQVYVYSPPGATHDAAGRVP